MSPVMRALMDAEESRTSPRANSRGGRQSRIAPPAAPARSTARLLMGYMYVLQTITEPHGIRLIEPPRITRISVGRAEVVLVVAVEQVLRIEGDCEAAQHMVAEGQVEPGLCLREDLSWLLAAAGGGTDVEARSPVVGYPHLDGTFLVDADEVIGPLG